MNTEKRHISSAFDRDLETIQALVVRMGGMVERAIADAATALETLDDELAEDVRRRDKEIDALDAQVNEEAARLIALRAPAATDLRLVLTVIKISAALERVGDYAKNMAKRSHVLATLPVILLFDGFHVDWTGDFIFALAWLVLVLSIGAISLLNLLIRSGSAVNVASLFYLTPLSTALIAFLMFDEKLGWLAVLGMGLAVSGVYLVARPAK